jgi:hypothetical protein
MVKKPPGTDEKIGGTSLNKSANIFATNPANAICGNKRITVQRVTLFPDLSGATSLFFNNGVPAFLGGPPGRVNGDVLGSGHRRRHRPASRAAPPDRTIFSMASSSCWGAPASRRPRSTWGPSSPLPPSTTISSASSSGHGTLASGGICSPPAGSTPRLTSVATSPAT